MWVLGRRPSVGCVLCVSVTLAPTPLHTVRGRTDFVLSQSSRFHGRRCPTPVLRKRFPTLTDIRPRRDLKDVSF